MTPKITQLPPLKLVGMRIQTSLANFGSPQLWQQFMPRRKQISNIASSENYSIQIYKKALSLKDFTPNTIFEYWAATPVTQFESIPDGMESLELDGGKYAVFIHKGTMAEFQNTLRRSLGCNKVNSQNSYISFSILCVPYQLFHFLAKPLFLIVFLKNYV